MNDIIEDAALHPGAVHIALVDAKTRWFYEIADWVREALNQIGIVACIVIDSVEGFANRWSNRSQQQWLVLTPEMHSRLPAGCIAYNFEQIDARASHVSPKALDHLASVCEGRIVWDFSTRNRNFWHARNIFVHHAPLVLSASMAYPKSMHIGGKCAHLGNNYGRRSSFIDELKRSIGPDFVCIQSAFCVGDAAILGRDLCAHAKVECFREISIVVNIKPVEPRLTCLETARLLSCIANGIFVISERDTDDDASRIFADAGVLFVASRDMCKVATALMQELPRVHRMANAIRDKLARDPRFQDIFTKAAYACCRRD